MRRLLPALFLAILTALPQPALEADPGGRGPNRHGFCGTSRDLGRILRSRHSRRRAPAHPREPAAQSLGALGDRIAGDLLVLEDEGDLIDYGVTDTLAIAERALALAGDRFDFLTILTASTFPGDVEPEAGFAFYAAVNNDLQGVNLPPLQDPEHAVLRGIVNLNDLEEYPQGPGALLPGFEGVVSGIEVLAHEASHWAAAYLAAPPGTEILGRDDAHWSFFLDTDGSVLEGNEWIDNGDGTFTTAPAAQQFAALSPLDLYLWGLIPPEQVDQPIVLIDQPTANPGQGRSSFPRGGFTTGGTRVELTLADLVGANGPRVPASSSAPTAFTMAFVLVVPFGQEPSPADLDLAGQFRTGIEAWFDAHTGGLGALDTAIPPAAVSGSITAFPRAGGPAPLDVEFRSYVSGSVTGLSWDFGDGATSADPSPTHRYLARGRYTVRLTLQGPGGPVVITRPGFIVVGDFQTLADDPFEADWDWEVSAQDTATAGRWERADPQGTYAGAAVVQPEDDATPGEGSLCYVTGAQAGASAGAYDVDGGATTLLSPALPTAGTQDAWLTYALWYTNDLGAYPKEDDFLVEASVDGGQTWQEVDRVTSSYSTWRRRQVPLAAGAPLPAATWVRFTASDVGGPSLVEAAIDDVRLIGIPVVDADADGVPDALDNCPLESNGSQDDADADGTGDPCDCAPADPSVSSLPAEAGLLLDALSGGWLSWEAAPQASWYNLYRGAAGPDPGAPEPAACLAPGLVSPGHQDGALPAAGGLYYYLVTAGNCFGEGTAGHGSSGAPRAASPCP
ncbi:MAG TPA: PKD domain-containing protein [Candidatus Polarisedimenticolia bacterium]|nr:PKD domain-containing protein [Candidatus Polarisedimenticolia bacterium]